MPEIENILSEGTEDALAIGKVLAKEARSASLLFFHCLKGSVSSHPMGISLDEIYCVTIATISMAEFSSSNSFLRQRNW
jgi:hypothetical protein